MVAERLVMDSEKLCCESIPEVIMWIWVKNSVRIIAHGLRFPIRGYSELGYTAFKGIGLIREKIISGRNYLIKLY